MNPHQNKLIELAKKCLYLGKYEYLNLIIDKLLQISSNDADVLLEIGKLYGGMKNYNYAYEFINKSFELEKSVETLQALANTNYLRGDFASSAIQYEELTKHIEKEEIYIQCRKSYENYGLDEEAIRIAKEEVDKFGTADSFSELIFLYITVGMEEEAIKYCEELKKKYPNHAITFNSLGFLYECIYNDYETAKKYFLKAAKMGFINAYYNLGVCCKQSEDLENAEKYLKRLITLDTKSETDYNYTLGSVYFAQRKMALGYKYYKNRSIARDLNIRNKNKYWDGKEYPNEILYVQHEQGFGDNIQFIRYLPMVAKKFKKVIYGTTSNLIELFKRSFPQEKFPNIEIVENNEVVRYNKFVLIMDIPNLLHQNFHNIPFQKSYLVADKRKQEMMKINYFNSDKVKIGLNWRAKGMALRDAVYRTIDAPYYFKPLFDIPNTEFYSFQMNDIFGMCEKYPQIIDLSKEIDTFDETAALLKNIDILITVDTALAHLAGALGVKTYLLLCHAPDWRWFENTEKTEWYPSITIIRQQDRRTWEDVSKKLYEYIKSDLT